MGARHASVNVDCLGESFRMVFHVCSETAYLEALDRVDDGCHGGGGAHGGGAAVGGRYLRLGGEFVQQRAQLAGVQGQEDPCVFAVADGCWAAGCSGVDVGAEEQGKGARHGVYDVPQTRAQQAIAHQIVLMVRMWLYVCEAVQYTCKSCLTRQSTFING